MKKDRSAQFLVGETRGRSSALNARPACRYGRLVAQASRLAVVTQPSGLQSRDLEVPVEKPPSQRLGGTAASREACATSPLARDADPSWIWRAGDDPAGSF